MRARSRWVVGGLIGAACAVAAIGIALSRGSGAFEGGTRTVTVTAQPTQGFDRAAPEAMRFGDLEFRGGLILSAKDPEFGGWSGLWRSEDGSRLIAISDRGAWMSATPSYRDGRIAGLDQVTIAPILAPSGDPIGNTPAYDTEALAIADGTAYIGIERTHEVMRFALGREGFAARGEPVPVPPEVKKLPENSSLEAIGVAPAASPIAGAVVIIAEQSGGEDATRGWILTGPSAGTFRVKLHDNFEVTDLAFLPSGDMLVLERFYTRAEGVKLRLRRVAAAEIKPGALIDGERLLDVAKGFDAGRGFEIDNMEGMALHRNAAGETILTLLSDDNFSSQQRTILLEFALLRP